MSKLYMIIPAYNEEKNIETVAEGWYKVLEKYGDAESRLVVIDDGSKDKTYEMLCGMKEKMPRLEAVRKENSGHGATVFYGYRYALEHGADFIFQTDSDGQTLPEEFSAFWDNMGEYDVVIGHRTQRKDGFSRILVTKVLKFVVLLIFHVNVTDANTPYRLMKKEVLQKYINRIPEGNKLTNVLLSVCFVKNNEKVLWTPITFRPRQGGKNSINIPRIVKIGIKAMGDFVSVKKRGI